MPPRDSSGHITPIHRAKLAAEACALVAAHEAARMAESPQRLGTLGGAFDLAFDPDRGKHHSTTSTQPVEWRRAREEALVVLPASTSLDDLAASSSALIASSALLRQAAGCSIPEWREHVESARLTAPAQEALRTTLIRAYRHALKPAVAHEPLKLSWAIRACQLVRAMLLHALKEDPKTMASCARFTLATDLDDRLMGLANEIGRRLIKEPNRDRPPLDATRKLMLFLTDPRQRMHSLLATAVGDVATVRVKRSHFGRTPDGLICIRPTTKDGVVPTNKSGSLAGWKYVSNADASAELQALIERHYGAQEAAYRAAPTAENDYGFLDGYEWDGIELVPLPAPEPNSELPQERMGKWVWMDPRLRLLLILGAEGRLHQFLRLRFTDIQLTESGYLIVRSQGAGKKRMSDLILCEVQADWLNFELRCGYLSALHAAFVAGKLADFPLFRAERLVAGRLPEDTSLHPQVDDKPVSDANEKLLALLGIPKPEQVNLRAWRRLFADLYRAWEVSPDVQQAITGHDPVTVSTRVLLASGAVPAQSSLRVYLDRAEEQLLLRAARVMQHTRTTYAATGAPCPRLT
ncbi:MAG: hypothetical protein MUF21_01080 [Gemmatimonadaceae bacterium]|nr:hypothetical protein [Gemmatimonadaceae bacterium]